MQDPQVLGNDHNKAHSLMSDPISTMYFHNMSCDLSNKILFKPMSIQKIGCADSIVRAQCTILMTSLKLTTMSFPIHCIIFIYENILFFLSSLTQSMPNLMSVKYLRRTLF